MLEINGYKPFLICIFGDKIHVEFEFFGRIDPQFCNCCLKSLKGTKIL